MRSARLLMYAVLLLAAGGCATRQPVPAWQARVAEYIRNEGRGDVNILAGLPRQCSGPGERPARAVIGECDVPVGLGERRDVQGLLLGCSRVAGAPSYVFVVGVVRMPAPGAGPCDPARDIEDVRVALLRPENEQLLWLVGERDDEALARYRAGRARARVLDNARDLFPGTGDLFRLDATDRVITVTEQRSGAAWRLALTRRS